KGITSAYFPVGGVLVSDGVAEVFESAGAEGALFTGYTYSAHPVGAAAVVACLSETLRLDTKANAAARGTQLYEGLVKLKEKHDVVGEVRGGHGLMCAVELVSDHANKTPVDAATVKRVHTAAYEAGVMVRIGLNNLLMSPPLTISEHEVTRLLAALDTGLAAA
ncbi:MAG: aminotransferase class III-fold pyridoxal phosphate-dependent enzyme, partial [Pseudomonadota bacterium]